ncbi:tRNA (adenosine(37)-N6)-threonylcarbamoyltransferase complex dimerization subunit type 1 TsaB [Legionella taurinensis]|uniref:tRNA threonylcarbamoyladenosine biosynthesis protein TsaB n=1 Tax=Legionella taurinensis TaxID=70611 RepID=A0A3A5L586_9GAMM|nr:tRNA (adenosine(37)-N6)-threonylcarbamoyltransferase complex dimerization subunit type 1 TsaB [Legionella taurinensis]MDX1837401.1 tRNA (adenosine(37)-N6)-threonylcarbamoyltransferase complex dimerization subunit type 1 TsaB [Legionella taurinensis]PUT40750.1 tRNA (adenosine(37)-N6)-threonylcarbamoyltransferase complex dimerization subunit type 1 TsaB [Legionella taurinensis]PUT44172.1 tRNA (adenosine(37)-N6)-threonylcarbamoyltransferase complex dimerization subunit type 1 TsaB [Legionella ta
MNLLAIDTSTAEASIGLSVNGRLWHESHQAERLHAQFILPAIERLLNQADCSLPQLDGIAFGRGPGSFTGLRIACSVAKGLAYAHDLPLYPVSSLAAIAEEYLHQHQIPWGGQPVLALLDARMQQLYWACFTDATLDVEEQVSDAADIPVPDTETIVLAGAGFATYRSQLSTQIIDKVSIEKTIFPQAPAMIRLVQAQKIKAVDAKDASPVYIRNKVTQGEARG